MPGKNTSSDLRERLVDKGIELLMEGGAKALTLRQCARRAGVSHAAPAHHFDGIKGLKTAIVARGHKYFAEMMQEEIDQAASDKRSQILAICSGYIRFAATYRPLFNLMFVPQSEFSADESRDAAGKMSRQILTDLCARTFPGPDQHIYEVAIWSLVHGYTKLVEIGRIQPGSNDQRDVDFARILNLLDFLDPPA